MNIIKADIWNFYNIKKNNCIVIPTNGCVDKYCNAVMGAGLAKQAKQYFKGLPEWLGKQLNYGNNVYLCSELNIVTFPTKHHWKDDSSLSLIEDSAIQLRKLMREYPGQYYAPKLGCGCGNLKWEQVEPILERYVRDLNIVERNW